MMSGNHALSVFTQSCLSTPRDPRTKLPSSRHDTLYHQLSTPTSRYRTDDRPHTTNGVFRRSPGWVGTHREREEPFKVSLKSNTPYINRASVGPRPNTATSVNKNASTGSPMPFNAESVSGNVRPTNGHNTTDYATLFATLLESNSLLREEIQKLRDEQNRTLVTVEQLHHRDHPVQKTSKTSVSQSHKIINTQHINGVGGGLSHSLPPQLLENTWVESSSEQGEAALPMSSSSSLSTQDSVHSLDAVASPDHELQEGIQDNVGSLLDTSSQLSLSVEDVNPEEILLDSSSSNSVLTHEEDGGSSESLCTVSETESKKSHAIHSEDDAFASPGVVAVEKMWDDFSVEEYAPFVPGGRERGKGGSLRSGAKEWSPKITIPKPFSMTIRQENSPKTKSRSLVIAEREKLEREVLEEAELRKKFRASPVPATTYLPLYELINAKNEQRREHIKQLSKDMLRSTEKPFSFMKREEKKKARDESLRKSLEMEKKQQQKEAVFVAKPVPKYLFDPQVNEKIQEQEEYRRIRIRMRAEELMSSSKLPGSMQLKGREYTIGALRQKRQELNEAKAFLTEEHKFHPAISGGVPDYDQAYFDFQRELARKKNAKQTTTSEPFYLRTELIPSRREQVMEDMKRDEAVLPESRWPFVAPRTKVPHTSPKCSGSQSATYPTQMTKTAKVRQSLTQEKLVSLAEKESAEEEQRQERKERNKMLKKNVSQKSMSYDPTAWLEEKKKQKLQEVRRLDKERQEKYQHQLREIEERVQSRPLLLEQVSQRSAVRAAKAKYTAALKKAGLSEDKIQELS